MFNWWELVGFITTVYYAFYLIVPWFLNCDVNLFLKKFFGKPTECLKGKVVWIVGASSGIGEHLAYELAKVNCRLVLSARRRSELDKVKENCLKVNSSLTDDDVLVLVMDVCDTASHGEAFGVILSKFKKLDVLVNNAGRSQRAVWEKVELDVDKQLFDLNVFSLVSLTRLVYKYFESDNNKKGQIVVTSSIAGILGIPFSGSYTGSKHALHGYFESLRREKMNKDIPITLVCPGAVQTPFLPESFTEKTGEKFGQQMVSNPKNKLTAECCANWMAIAIANQVDECWIAKPLSIQLAYLACYYPNLGSIVFNWLGQVFLQRLRDDKVTVADAEK